MTSTFVRRYWRILVVGTLGAVLAFAGSFMVDATYESSTLVLIRGRDATFLSSTGEDLSAQPGVVDSSLAQSLAATYAGTASSRAVATSVVEELALDERPRKSGPIAAVASGLAWVYRCGRAFVTSGFCADVDPYEEAVRQVQEGTAVAPLGANAGGTAGTTGSYVLQVTATGRTPEEARQVTNAVADELVRVSQERFATESASNIERLEGLVAESEEEVADRRAELAQFQTDNGLLAADGGQLLSATTYESLRTDLLTAQAQAADLEGQLAAVTAELRATPRTTSSIQSIVTGRSTTQMSTDAASAVYAQLEVTQATTQAQLTGVRARVTELQSIIDGASVLADNAVLADLSALENSLMLAQTNLTSSTQMLQAARVTAAQNPTDLTRLDEAAAPAYPTSPKRYIYLALGLLIGGLAGAVLTARARRQEVLDPSEAAVPDADSWEDVEADEPAELDLFDESPVEAGVASAPVAGRVPAGAHGNGAGTASPSRPVAGNGTAARRPGDAAR